MRRQHADRNLRRARTHQRLLEGAACTFARHGYEGATVEELAREAGYSKGAYYFHFAAKENVLLALAEQWIRTRSERLHAAQRDGQPAAALLLDTLEALLTYDDDAFSWPRLLLEFWSQATRQELLRRALARAYESWRQRLVSAFERAQAEGIVSAGVRPEAAADLALALHDGLAVQGCLIEPGQQRPSSRRWLAALLALLATGAPPAESGRAQPAARPSGHAVASRRANRVL